MTLNDSQKWRLYREMLRIRQVEVRIEDLYHEAQMKTPVHLCIGQEAIAVGLCAHLRDDDTVSSNHRSHGHYLAKGGDLDRMIAELHCKETGCTRGRGGSMHVVDRAVGHLGSSSIVGGGIPIGAGLAMAAQMRGLDEVAVVFFGDGALDEGVLYESVNFAVLKRLPVVFVYENNGWSVCSPVAARQGTEPIFHRMDPDKLWSGTVDGNDVEAVYEAAGTAVTLARSGGGPSFLECKTYRMREHAGSGCDMSGKYRDPEEIEGWEAKDPVARYREQLLAEGVLSEPRHEDLLRQIEAEIDAAFHFAVESPLPKDEELSLYVHTEDR